MRLRERRRYDCSGPAPSLSVAMRQLRMRILDARGVGAAAFADRTQAVALLAQLNGEPDAESELQSLAMIAMRGRAADIRPALYDGLDRAHAALRTYH